MNEKRLRDAFLKAKKALEETAKRLLAQEELHPSKLRDHPDYIAANEAKQNALDAWEKAWRTGGYQRW